MKQKAIIFGAVLLISASIVNSAYGSSISGTVKVASSNANVVVYIQHSDGVFTPESVVMDQIDMKFVPHVLPIVMGSTVGFHNSDYLDHNIFSPDGEMYDLGTWERGKTVDHTFTQCDDPPCVYVQLCGTHPAMEGYVVVLQNPFFAVTDRDGNYEINDVPVGSYTLEVWHESGKTATDSVTVKSNDSLTVNFSLK